MKKTPESGRYLDADEKAFVEAFETSDAPLKSGLTPKRRREIESMARAAMTDERAPDLVARPQARSSRRSTMRPRSSNSAMIVARPRAELPGGGRSPAKPVSGG